MTTMYKLTVAQCNSAKPRTAPYKLTDGGGMYLLVKPSKGKYWRFDYRFMGKRKTLAIGVFPETSLAEARTLHQAARTTIRHGDDPMEVRRATLRAGLLEQENCFSVIANDWFNTRMTQRSEKHRARVRRALDKDILPFLGSRPLTQIVPREVLAVLKRIEARGAVETAHRTKQIAGQVFRYGIASGRCASDPTIGLQGALASPQKRHIAAITDPQQVGELMRAIEGYQGTPVIRTALQISALSFQRPGEVRHMEWSDIDWLTDQWNIPAAKMKNRVSHVVPLSHQAITHLKAIEQHTGGGRYVFPSFRGRNRPLSDNGTRTALRSMGYTNEEMSPHGFRAMARTLLDEALGFRLDIIEMQLAHSVRDGFYPVLPDTSKKPDNGQKECLCRSEDSTAWSSSKVLLNRPVNQV